MILMHHVHGSPVFWSQSGNTGMLYVSPEDEQVKAYFWNGSQLTSSPIHVSTVSAPVHSMPGGTLSLSANGATEGILWATMPLAQDALHANVAGVLRAFNASNLQELWHSELSSARDQVGLHSKGANPTITNGKVFTPSHNTLHAYGLLDYARVASHAVPPANASIGEKFRPTVSMKNVGGNTWTNAQSYRLGSMGDTATWGVTRVGIGTPVALGQTKTFVIPATAPTTSGQYVFQFQMLREFVHWFGEQEPVVTVNVGTPLWGDVNGDRTADYCELTGTANHIDSQIRCTPSTRIGFGTPFSSGVIDWGYSEGRALVDINNDGRSDYCRVVGLAPNNLKVRCDLSTGTGFGTSVESVTIDVGLPDTRVWTHYTRDGFMDFCRVLSSSQLACTVSQGTSFGTTYISPVIEVGEVAGRSWADVNYDATNDYCRIVGTSPNQRIRCELSDNLAPTGWSGYIESAPGIDAGQEHGRAFVDFNGDGKADYCRLVGSTNLIDSRLRCTRSLGNGFVGTAQEVTSGIVDWG
jgi:hypothetical protein